MALARAQLLDQSRRSGGQNLSLPPDLAARLQAARQQVKKITSSLPPDKGLNFKSELSWIDKICTFFSA